MAVTVTSKGVPVIPPTLPVAASYQIGVVPVAQVAVNLTVPEPQTAPPVAAVGAAGTSLIVKVTVLRLISLVSQSVAVFWQPTLYVRLINSFGVKLTLEPVPTKAVPSYHLAISPVPHVAVRFTLSPKQISPVLIA